MTYHQKATRLAGFLSVSKALPCLLLLTRVCSIDRSGKNASSRAKGEQNSELLAEEQEKTYTNLEGGTADQVGSLQGSIGGNRKRGQGNERSSSHVREQLIEIAVKHLARKKQILVEVKDGGTSH